MSKVSRDELLDIALPEVLLGIRDTSGVFCVMGAYVYIGIVHEKGIVSIKKGFTTYFTSQTFASWGLEKIVNYKLSDYSFSNKDDEFILAHSAEEIGDIIRVLRSGCSENHIKRNG